MSEFLRFNFFVWPEKKFASDTVSNPICRIDCLPLSCEKKSRSDFPIHFLSASLPTLICFPPSLLLRLLRSILRCRNVFVSRTLSLAQRRFHPAVCQSHPSRFFVESITNFSVNVLGPKASHTLISGEKNRSLHPFSEKCTRWSVTKNNCIWRGDFTIFSLLKPFSASSHSFRQTDKLQSNTIVKTCCRLSLLCKTEICFDGPLAKGPAKEACSSFSK